MGKSGVVPRSLSLSDRPSSSAAGDNQAVEEARVLSVSPEPGLFRLHACRLSGDHSSREVF